MADEGIKRLEDVSRADDAAEAEANAAAAAAEPQETEKKYYAWSRIMTGMNEYVEPGTEVSQSSLSVDDEEWKLFVDRKIVRKAKFPDGLGTYESPRRAMIRQAKEAMDAAVGGTEDDE